MARGGETGDILGVNMWKRIKFGNGAVIYLNGFPNLFTDEEILSSFCLVLVSHWSHYKLSFHPARQQRFITTMTLLIILAPGIVMGSINYSSLKTYFFKKLALFRVV